MEYFPILFVAVASVCVTAFSVTTILKHRESEAPSDTAPEAHPQD